MKAIHNTSAYTSNNTLLCSIRQIYKMKAIHNLIAIVIYSFITVFNTSNIQNESNSQRPVLNLA